MQSVLLGADRDQICLLLRGIEVTCRGCMSTHGWALMQAWRPPDMQPRGCRANGTWQQPVPCRHACPCAPLCMHAAVPCAPGPAGLDIAVEGVPDPPGACPPELRGCCPCAPYARELRLGRSAAPVDCCAAAVLGAPVLFAGESVLPRSSTWLRELSATSPACT